MASEIQSPKSKIVILGGGPAGLYAALLIRRANPAHDILVIERNPPNVTYGWGVVFSDRTLASFQRADYKTYEQITETFVIWDAIDVRYRGETIRCGGHVIAAISRKALLEILQRRCAELGVAMRFNTEVNDLSELPEHDLLIGADGVNSVVRRAYEEHFQPRIELGKAKYIWYGADRVLDAFTFIFHENEHGLFTIHAYPFSGTLSTFIVECAEQTWLNAGLDKADEVQSLAYCQLLLSADMRGATLLSNNSKWISFPTLVTKTWQQTIQNPNTQRAPEIQNRAVLLGDAAHTAHFSIGSGTKLAMEDAIALANALEHHDDLDMALNEYELERRPVVETFQRAAKESQTYFEMIKRYTSLKPVQFTFQLLTRSGRISYDDLHFRDARYGDSVDRWHTWNAECGLRIAESSGAASVGVDSVRCVEPLVAPPPMFAPFKLRSLILPNRVVRQQSTIHDLHSAFRRGAGLILTEICAISPEGRITPEDAAIYQDEHLVTWRKIVERVHEQSGCIGVPLGHAGRRGATRPRSEGLDRPLREGGWLLLSASPIPYTPKSQVPKEMDRADMGRVRDHFVQAARMANDAGFDLLQLHFAQGYLMAGFLSPLTNQRDDEYGGSLENRMRFPLEVFQAVRAAWPQEKPVSVAISATDYVKGGFQVEEAVEFATRLKESGCDLVEVLAGQTTPEGEPPYGRGFLTPLSDRIRNEAGILTMVGGYLTTSNDVNTILAAGKADLCIMALEDR